MYIQITPRARVYVTQEQIDFINKYKNHDSFRNTNLEVHEITIAKILADKSVLVSKKLDNDVQFALNRYVRFVEDGDKK